MNPRPGLLKASTAAPLPGSDAAKPPVSVATLTAPEGVKVAFAVLDTARSGSFAKLRLALARRPALLARGVPTVFASRNALNASSDWVS
ncbi:MAG: hypothetical protein EOO81_04830 [Oxalobacteraceae bacterium]|nr:MAG: hypothetical protein EOO81_04830 [Oxalobacteraceae bacterium]